LRSYSESTRHFFIPPSSPEVIIYEISNLAWNRKIIIIKD
jgi:hypothetical protein